MGDQRAGGSSRGWQIYSVALTAANVAYFTAGVIFYQRIKRDMGL